MEKTTDQLTPEQMLRMHIIEALYVEMTKLGRPAAGIISDAVLFEKYIKTGERP